MPEKEKSIISAKLESGKNSTWLAFPTSAAELNKALMDIDALDRNYSIVDCRTSPSMKLNDTIVGENINDVEDLARYYIFESDMVDMPDKWKEGVDIPAFGAHIEQLEKGNYTSKGYLFLSGDAWEKFFEKPRNLQPYLIDNYLKNAEASTEQNYNQLDSLINNKAQPDADLTDGQTYDKIQELAPETLPDNDKPSILGQLKEAKEDVPKLDENAEKKVIELDL